MRPGTVYLVGAGPGDAGLLTLRGAELLRAADVILHDRLVSEDHLAHAAPHAQIIDAGKGHDGHGMSQDTINALLIEHARAGRTVVRLKGGDPFVFGRGSEELESCRAAGIDCEVVPGVSSAIAGPAAAGIPVTARNVARSFAVVTARTAAGGAGSPEYMPAFDALVKIDTLVMLMGCKDLAEISAGLIAAGKDPATPAALVERATWPTQRTTQATLATVARAAREHHVKAPVLLVVGPTAHWGTGEGRLLAGRRIAVTRPRAAGADLARRLRYLGATVIECPLIRIEYRAVPVTPGALDVDWVVFTSLHGVRGFFLALAAAGLDGRALHHARIAAVGAKTAAELWQTARLKADLVPDEHRAAALVEALKSQIHRGDSVLFPCGTLARDELPDGLRSVGADVRELEVYATTPTPPNPTALAELQQGVDAILLYSPSGVRALAGHRDLLKTATLICVGPTTANAVTELGLGSPIIPSVYGDEGVLSLALASLGSNKPVTPPRTSIGNSESEL